MGRIIDELFYLRRGERRALASVMLILIGSLVFRLTVKELPVQHPEPDSLFLQQMLDMQQKMQSQYSIRTLDKQSYSSAEDLQPVHARFCFDPNTLSEDSLELLGLSTRVRTNLIKYRDAGGRFASAGDLAKIYGMDPSLAEDLLPYIIIAEDRQEIADERRKAAEMMDPEIPVEAPKLELNGADTIALRNIQGIGIAYSRRIFRYRELLGGFYRMEQLWEVYGMDSTRYASISRQCTIHSDNISKIPLNTAGFRDLVSHPYINKAETYAILQYREFADSIAFKEQLLEDQIIDPERFRRVSAYLSVD